MTGLDDICPACGRPLSLDDDGPLCNDCADPGVQPQHHTGT